MPNGFWNSDRVSRIVSRYSTCLDSVMCVSICRSRGEWRGGISPPGPPRTGRESLDSSGSYHPVVERPLGRPCDPVSRAESSPLRVVLLVKPDDTPPSLHPRYGISSLLRSVPPLCPASVLWLLRIPPLELLPWHRDDRFPCSVKEPESGSRRLYAGCRPGRRQAPPGLIPAEWAFHWF